MLGRNAYIIARDYIVFPLYEHIHIISKVQWELSKRSVLSTNF